MRDAWILSIGTELTLGQTVDTNAPWLARELAALGLRCAEMRTISDDLEPITRSIRAACEAERVILITGGLGPTDDDLTRNAIAVAAEVDLELCPRSLDALRAFFAARGRDMPDRNQVQAMIPRGATAIDNTCGTAPGIHTRLSGADIFAMPGVPYEMKTMFHRDVAPALRAFGGGAVLLSRIVRTCGLPEATLGRKIATLMTRGRNPEVGTTASLSEIGVRINATAPSREQAATMLDQTEAEIRNRLGDIVYGRDDDTLAGAVGGLLRARSATLALAESCTGGLIGELMTDIAGSSEYFLGGVISYANSAKRDLLGVRPETLDQHGAVSEQSAIEMAIGARKALGADFALSVTGIAGPGGGSTEKPVGLVYIGIANPTAAIAREYHLGFDSPRDVIRQRAARVALNELRRHLLRDQAK
ncbi:MAG: competence/damage-inducible protein A [Phycisphaerales bacterium]|nr:competence/damage-inducible protein A [Phycisphaerales bacterium]